MEFWCHGYGPAMRVNAVNAPQGLTAHSNNKTTVNNCQHLHTPVRTGTRQVPVHTGTQLPAGWRWAKLGDVCVINPSRPSGFHRAEDTPTTFVPMSAVDQTDGVIARPVVRPFSQVRKGYTYFGEGDVLFAKITPCMQNGKHAIARDLIDGFGFGTTEFHVLRPHDEVIAEWIHFFLRQPRILDEAEAAFTGSAGQQRVPEAFLTSLEIPLPPLPEQHRIVAVLQEQMEAVAAARRAVGAQLKATRALPTAFLRDTFTSLDALAWPKQPFGELVENFDGRRVPVKMEDRRNRKGKYPYYGASGIIDYVDDFLFDGDYLLIGEDGANLVLRSSPIAFKANGKFWVNNHAHVVQPKNGILLDYLLHFFSATDLKPYVAGAAQPKMTQADMNSIPVPLPSLDVQQRIVSKLSVRLYHVANIQQSLKDKLAIIERLPAAVLREAFDGRI